MREGAREQLDRVMRQNLPNLLGFAVRLTGCPDQGEDLVQETMLRAIRNWSRFRGDANPRTWLFSIAVNVFRDRLKSRANQQRQLDRELMTHVDGPEQQSMAIELKEAISRQVSRLPPRQREVLVLKTYEEMSVAEIGKVLGMKPANVYTTLHHARNTLKEKLKSFLEVPPETKSGRS